MISYLLDYRKCKAFFTYIFYFLKIHYLLTKTVNMRCNGITYMLVKPIGLLVIHVNYIFYRKHNQLLFFLYNYHIKKKGFLSVRFSLTTEPIKFLYLRMNLSYFILYLFKSWIFFLPRL